MIVDDAGKQPRRTIHGAADSEPNIAAGLPVYDHDGEEASPMSPGLSRMRSKAAVAGRASYSSDDDRVGACHRATNVIAVALLVALLLASLVCIAAGACCLASLRGKPFERFALFFTLGVVPVAVGVVAAIVVCAVLAVLVFSTVCCGGVKNYGMCCLHTTRLRAVGRVCVYGILPFVLLILLIVLALAGFVIFSLSQQLPDLRKDYIRVNGLRGPVDISRDNAGLTHIRAGSRRDAYFAQGFAEAQDRLFQLEFHRLVAKGELAAIAGNAALETDKAIRTLNVRDAALALCENMGDDMRNLTQAFADGINVYLQRERKRPVEFFFLGPQLLRFHQPAPFSYTDVCLTGRLFQWQMSSNMAAEQERFKVWLHSNRTYNEVDELYANFSSEKTTILSAAQMTALMTDNNDIQAGSTADETIARNVAAQRSTRVAEAAAYDGLFMLLQTQLPSGLRKPGSNADVAAQRDKATTTTTTTSARTEGGAATAPASTMDRIRARVHETLQARFLRQLGGGSSSTDATSAAEARTLARRNTFAYKYLHASNAWASRDAAGHAVVASDAHLVVNLPSVWYYTHMSFPVDDAATAGGDGAMFDAAGVALIGLPGVHIGRTNTVAWGITMSMTDLEDLYVLPRTPYVAQNDSYAYGGTMQRFTTRQERIRVKGGDDVVLYVRETLLGPVVNELLDLPDEWLMVLSAVPLRRDDGTSMRALLGMTDPAVDSAEKMMRLLLTLQAPGFSIPIADSQGNVAYAVTGRHPLRNADHTGKFPTCLCNATQVMQSVCVYVKSARGIHVTPQTCVLSTDDMTHVPLNDVVHAAYAAIDAGNWETYVSLPQSSTGTTTTAAAAAAADGGDDGETTSRVRAADRFVPVNGNPHVHIPFSNGNAAYIVAANHKIVPDGYTYHLGDEYSWSSRGQRIAELLALAPPTTLASVDFHQSIQLDHRSNFFVNDMAAVLRRAAFQRSISDDKAAMHWSTRLLEQWQDARADLGSVEAAFFWRWMQRMSVFPRDALTALSMQHWPTEQRYLVTALTSPSPRMLRECAYELQQQQQALQQTGDDGADACVQFAAYCFKQQVAASSGERWGIDINHLRGVHELLQGIFVAPVFEREIGKPGDESSVCVSHHSLDDNMLSIQASSMRLLFDLGANAQTLRFALPGGQSGNPYSRYYNNLLDEYFVERYIDTAVTRAAYEATSFAAQQTLHP